MLLRPHRSGVVLLLCPGPLPARRSAVTRPIRTTAPPARLALRHASGLCTVDAELLNVARLMDEREHEHVSRRNPIHSTDYIGPGWPDGVRRG